MGTTSGSSTISGFPSTSSVISGFSAISSSEDPVSFGDSIGGTGVAGTGVQTAPGCGKSTVFSAHAKDNKNITKNNLLTPIIVCPYNSNYTIFT